jgi:hypothetical protein
LPLASGVLPVGPSRGMAFSAARKLRTAVPHVGVIAAAQTLGGIGLVATRPRQGRLRQRSPRLFFLPLLRRPRGRTPRIVRQRRYSRLVRLFSRRYAVGGAAVRPLSQRFYRKGELLPRVLQSPVAISQGAKAPRAEMGYTPVSFFNKETRIRAQLAHRSRLDFDFRLLMGQFRQPQVRYRPGMGTY